jgi:integrase/recombinase XerD
MNTIRETVEEYLTMRRALGFKLRAAGARLLKFVTFMEQQRASFITHELALRWAQQSLVVQPSTWAQRLSFVRGFARYRSATDPRTQIPPEGLLPFRSKRARPYFYTDTEIQSLLRAALNLPTSNGKLRPWTYHSLLGLLSVAGMRLGEACNLELHDLDLKSAVLTVRGAKFGKSRLLPLHASTCKVLAAYIIRRERVGRHGHTHLICSCPVEGIGWMRQRFAEPFMRYLVRSGCVVQPLIMDHGYMI